MLLAGRSHPCCRLGVAQHSPPRHHAACRVRAHHTHRGPPAPLTPSPTPIDGTPSTPAELTLVETQGRSLTTHSWTRTNTADSSSSTSSTSSSSTSSSIDEASGTDTSSSSSSSSGFQYSRSHQLLPGGTGGQQQAPWAGSSDSSSSDGRVSGQPSANPWAEQVSRGREALSGLFLPAGWPGSVSSDYLTYQLATVPAHITGWLSISLTTSSLLKAVGISAGPVGATAAAAAIKWIVKDGIGAAGRLLVGGRLGLEFDDDPRCWRMAAEALATLGLSLEIATSVFPQHFLLLASLGNFSKAVGKGMGRPVFRVVQNHFAASGNVGAVAAKEEVWEVSAQLAGYSASVLLLQQLQDAGSWQSVVGVWALVQGAHVALRYNALKTLRFRYLNQKRAKLLVCASVRGRPLPSVAEANQAEPMFLSAADMAPAVSLGVSLAEAWGVEGPGQLGVEQLGPWWGLYGEEGYLLTWREGRAAVVLKEGGSGGGDGSASGGQQQQQQEVLLRALWQAAWLDAHAAEHQQQQKQRQHQQQQQSQGHQLEGLEQRQQQQQQQQDLALLEASLLAVRREFGGFMQQAEAAGWRTDQLVLKVGASRVQQLQGSMLSKGSTDSW